MIYWDTFVKVSSSASVSLALLVLSCLFFGALFVAGAFLLSFPFFYLESVFSLFDGKGTKPLITRSMNEGMVAKPQTDGIGTHNRN